MKPIQPVTQTEGEQLDALCRHLAARRAAILLAWRQAADDDPQQTTVHSLTRGQFNDHIPQVLDAFERQLRAQPGGAASEAAGRETKREEIKHGLHRWQQGYRLQEIMHEWGHLQLCLFDEVAGFAASHPGFGARTLAAANRRMIVLVSDAISESTAQYERMQRAEAEGRMADLEGALASINEVERRRAALIHEAVHDIDGNVFGVTLAAKLLGGTEIEAAERAEFAEVLQQGVQSVTEMLRDLKELARLEAGRETREIATFDAAELVRELGNFHRPIADGRGLFLEVRGPRKLMVEGDAAKVRRLLQNLLLNALKYTERGGVTMSLGEEAENWWLMIKDTGPGLLAGPGAPIVRGLKEATASARESDEKEAAIQGERSHVLVPPPRGTAALQSIHQQPGEGIGLSIVKRLCELLDASLEMASAADTGTTFRVVLPRTY